MSGSYLLLITVLDMRALPRFRFAHSTSALFVLCASAKTDLTFYEVPPDGDCLFSAVALSAAITDNQPDQASARALRTAAGRLRAQALDLLCPSGVPDPELSIGGLPASLLIEPLGGESEAGYCRRLRQGGEWGSTAEVLALTEVLQRPIRVHTTFGVEEYGATDDDGTGKALALSVYFEENHYTAVVEALPAPTAQVDEEDTDFERSGGGGTSGKGRVNALRGGATASGSCASETDDEAAIGAVLDALHAASAAADASAYFGLFAPDAVFLGTDPHERWPLEDFREYAGSRFARGDGWSYAVLERHVTVRDTDVAWFDERLHNAKLGACRGSGVLVRYGASSWRIAQYNLLMAIPNEKALDVAALVNSQ